MVTSCKALPELLLLLPSSPPSPCRGEERRTSITEDPGTRLLFELEPRVWSCGYPEPGFAPVVLWNHVCPWPRRDRQSQEQGFGGVCSADGITVHSSISTGLKEKEKEGELTGNIGNKESCVSVEKPCTQCDF